MIHVNNWITLLWIVQLKAAFTELWHWSTSRAATGAHAHVSSTQYPIPTMEKDNQMFE